MAAPSVAKAIEALRARAGPMASERTLAVLAAVPSGGVWRPGVDQEISNAGGRVVIRGEVLVGFFTSVSHAWTCAMALMKTGTEPPGALTVGLDHTSVTLDAGGNAAGSSLAELSGLCGIATRGQVLVSDRAVAHLTGVRSTVVAKIPRTDAPTIVVHEVAWHPKQRIGVTTPKPVLLIAGAVLLSVGGVFLYSQYDRAQFEAEDRAAMMMELPVPRTEKGASTEGDAQASRAAPKPVRRQGTLTLLTTPSAEVKLKGKTLGSTPLFNVVLDAGTHVLELRGPDGQARVLSAPIRNGENTAFRLKLEELPAARR